MISKKNRDRRTPRRRIIGALAVWGLAGALIAAAPSPGVAATSHTATSVAATSHTATSTASTTSVQQVCPAPAPGHAQCMAMRVVESPKVSPDGLPNDNGYVPSDLRSAYNLVSASAAGGKGQTVALVDAYDNPYAESDLAQYRSSYGLPACTTANGCFRKVNQSGVQGDYPQESDDWAGEEDLDLDMVSAICPNCHLILVEAGDNSTGNLGASVNTAVALGAKFVSNSYGGPVSIEDPSFDAADYDHPGVVITASTGDSGFAAGPAFPAASPHVVAVGGTSLEKASTSRGWAEITWKGAMSGCSSFDAKPSWQNDTGCATRTEADVSAVSDPATGVTIYDTQYDGWAVFGGTSAASPIIAAVYALGGTQSGYPARNTYAEVAADHSSVNDVVAGTNDPEDAGSCQGQAHYLCNAVAGYDGPTGLGTPNGITAFRP